jgi:hypothetical protein
MSKLDNVAAAKDCGWAEGWLCSPDHELEFCPRPHAVAANCASACNTMRSVRRIARLSAWAVCHSPCQAAAARQAEDASVRLAAAEAALAAARQEGGAAAARASDLAAQLARVEEAVKVGAALCASEVVRVCC